MPYIQADWTLALWAMIFAVVAFGIWAQTTTIGKHFSAVIIVLVAAMILANVGIIPNSAPVYGIVSSVLVPLAIPLLLFKANIKRIIIETKTMMTAFLLGVLGTSIGAIIGVWLLPLGEEAHNLAGIFSASYIGGSMNFVAVAETLQVDKALLTPSYAADNVAGTIYLAILVALPAISMMRRLLPSPIIENPVKEENLTEIIEEKANLNILHICILLGLSASIVAVSDMIAVWLGIDNYNILFMTAISVAIANVFPNQMNRLHGDFEIGMLLMYMFFVVIGASADVIQLIDSALVLVVFCSVIIFVHAIVIFGGSSLFKLDLADVIVASCACAGGPAAAAGLAAGKQWNHLVTAGLMCGIFGHVLANFIGVAIATYLSMN